MEKMTVLHGRLLEGCIWDECSEKLYFVDIECRKIYCLSPDCESLNQMGAAGLCQRPCAEKRWNFNRCIAGWSVSCGF